ncbi:hypothetical protein EVAR_10630_1 [Eumeta japonica]|uniref:Uncharacterized protein n=1 Tax=Eumeta variegata TaxID=151549 RepID=A0A4C1U1Y2_EUMVA|nr:hypothetical protein EVAR_10630_1 [Eumeta japonica]
MPASSSVMGARSPAYGRCARADDTRCRSRFWELPSRLLGRYCPITFCFGQINDSLRASKYTLVSLQPELDYRKNSLWIRAPPFVTKISWEGRVRVGRDDCEYTTAGRIHAAFIQQRLLRQSHRRAARGARAPIARPIGRVTRAQWRDVAGPQKHHGRAGRAGNRMELSVHALKNRNFSIDKGDAAPALSALLNGTTCLLSQILRSMKCCETSKFACNHLKWLKMSRLGGGEMPERKWRRKPEAESLAGGTIFAFVLRAWSSCLRTCLSLLIDITI